MSSSMRGRTSTMLPSHTWHSWHVVWSAIRWMVTGRVGRGSRFPPFLPATAFLYGFLLFLILLASAASLELRFLVVFSSSSCFYTVSFNLVMVSSASFSLLVRFRCSPFSSITRPASAMAYMYSNYSSCMRSRGQG